MSRLGGRMAAIGLATALALLPASAQADTNLGDLGTNHDCGGDGYTEIQASTGAAPRYDVPADGVITSWRLLATAETNVIVRLKMFRPTANPNQFTLIGQSLDQGPLTPDVLNGPFPTSIPVKAGDLLGVFVVDGDGYGCLFDTATDGDVAREVNPDDSNVGDTVTTNSTFTPARVNVAATLGPPPAPTPVTHKKCKKKKHKRSAESAKKKCKKKKRRK